MTNILKQAYNDTKDLNSKQVVKVAGVVRRLYNWFKQLSSDEYAQQVLNLRNESTTVKSYMDNLSVQLDRLQKAITDADVADYEQALDEVKYLSKQLSDELDRLNSTANKTDLPTNKDDKPVSSEQQMQQEQAAPPEVLQGRINKPLKNIPHLANLSISISDTAKERAFSALANYDLSKVNKDHFIELFKNAIGNGIVTQIYPVKKEKRDLQNYVTVKTAPFSVPNLPLKLSAAVLLNEIPGAKLSVMRVLSFDSEKIASSDINNITKLSGQVDNNFVLVDEVDFAQALMAAHQNVFGKAPNAQTLGVLWAQAVLESGRKGNKVSLKNNNIGGITAGDYDKKFNGKGWMESNKPYTVAKTGLKFKSFDSVLDGATEYVKTLNNLYPDSFKWKAAGMPFEDAIYMASKNYYGPITVESYGGPMDNLFNEFMNKIYPKLNPKPENKPLQPPGPAATQYKRFGENPYLPKGTENIVLKKPELKSTQYAWKSDNDSSLNSGSNNSSNNEVGGFMNYLFSGKLDKIVKESLEKKLLQNNILTIKLLSSNSFNSNCKFSLALCDVLKDSLNADTNIYSDENSIDIECTVSGNKKTVIDAVSAVCSAVSLGFANKYNKVITTSINFEKTGLNKISHDDLLKNERMFHLNEVIK